MGGQRGWSAGRANDGHRWLALGLSAVTALLVASVGPARAAVHRGPVDCAVHLDCRVGDLDAMTVPERLVFLRAVERGPASAVVPGFDRWRCIEGVLEFFADDGLGDSGGWMSVVDAAILEGLERGTAIALGESTDSFGNPGAPLWASYLRRLRLGELTERDEHDAAWSTAEQAATDHGVALAAARGLEPTVVEQRFYWFSQLYRWTMRHEDAALPVLARAPYGLGAVQRQRPLLWLTDVRDDEPTRRGAELAYRISEYDLLGAALRTVDVLVAYLPHLIGRAAP